MAAAQAGVQRGVLLEPARVAAGGRIKTFSIGIPGEYAAYDERQFARQVAARFGTEHEELEVDPRKLVIEAAEADRRYDNPDSQLHVQITGGSTSVRTSWQPLRVAGATARELLRHGAAATWQVPVAECVAADGAGV